MNHDLVAQTARQLESAWRLGVPMPPVRDALGAGNLAAAYAVQEELTALRVARGARVVGRKIGLTSRAVQQQLGVDQPDFGVLFDDMAYPDGAAVPTDRLVNPKVEAEVAFVLDRDLVGEITMESVRAAVKYAIAALEIVDSRIDGWDITIVDTVADNGSSALFVLGEDAIDLDHVEPRDVEMSMTVDGVEKSSGKGTACLGDPLEALAWLARTAQSLGEPLRAEQIILSGALGPMVAAVPGQSIRAEVSGLGAVSASFHSEVTV